MDSIEDIAKRVMDMWGKKTLAAFRGEAMLQPNGNVYECIGAEGNGRFLLVACTTSKKDISRLEKAIDLSTMGRSEDWSSLTVADALLRAGFGTGLSYEDMLDKDGKRIAIILFAVGPQAVKILEAAFNLPQAGAASAADAASRPVMSCGMDPKRMLIQDALKDPEKQWQVIASILLNSLDQVSLPESGPIPSIPKWLARLSDAELNAADELCRTFCANWKWPSVQGALRYQLFFRALCASEFASVQGHRRMPPPPDVLPWPETLPHLLIELWRDKRLLWAANRHPLGSSKARKPLERAFDAIKPNE